MNAYIKKNTDGDIILYSQEPFEGSVEVDYGVVLGWDGRLYKAGEEPTPPPPTLEEQLAAIESEYAPRIAALQTALVAATLTDGTIMDGNISSLRAEWVALLNSKSAATEALLI